MTKSQRIYFERGSIRVTSRTLRTRFKDEDLTPVQSVQIGYDTVWIGGAVAFGLLAFANRFGDLLFLHEQALIAVAGIVSLVMGLSFATLQVGQHMRCQ